MLVLCKKACAKCRVATHLEKSGKLEKVRETEIYLDFERAEFCSFWAWTLDMFIIDTLVAFSKLVTMLVIIIVKQRLFKRYAVYR